MSVRSRLGRRADRAADKAERLLAKGGLRNIQRARRLQEQAAHDYDTYSNWHDERWG